MLDLYVDVTAEENDAVDVIAEENDATSSTQAAPQPEEPSPSEDQESPQWLDLPADTEGEGDSIFALEQACYLDDLPEDSDLPVANLEGVCTQLFHYLIRHPQNLVTRRRKVPGKGSKSRYFGGDGPSEDVMADKVVTGCWACGKWTHESGDCHLKRCFVCSGQGHEGSACPNKRNICRRCTNIGHMAEECPDTEYFAGLGNEEDVFFCRCVSCGIEGHINCSENPTAIIPEPCPGPSSEIVENSYDNPYLSAVMPPSRQVLRLMPRYPASGAGFSREARQPVDFRHAPAQDARLLNLHPKPCWNAHQDAPPHTRVPQVIAPKVQLLPRPSKLLLRPSIVPPRRSWPSEGRDGPESTWSPPASKSHSSNYKAWRPPSRWSQNGGDFANSEGQHGVRMDSQWNGGNQSRIVTQERHQSWSRSSPYGRGPINSRAPHQMSTGMRQSSYHGGWARNT